MKELEGPPFPSLLTNVWSAFVDLSNSRQTNGMGLNPLSYSEIKAYSELTNNRLNQREVYALKILDRKYLEVMNANG